MASFEIPDGPTTVKLTEGPPRTGSIVFAVNNKSGEVRAARLGVQVAGDTKAEWFTIDGERERDVPTTGSETVKVNISVPAEVKEGTYPFRLRVVAVNDPDNDHADGPATTVEVPKAPIPDPKPKWWIWVLVAVAVLALGGGLAWWLLQPKDERPAVVVETATPEPVATEPVATTAAVPDLVGKTLAEAQTSAGSDFVVTPTMAVGGDKPVGQVYEQLPAANSRQNKGIPVTVKIDPGIEVPDLRGSTSDGAIRQLSGLGLHVKSSTTRCDPSGVAGQIVDQAPANGARIKSNSGIDITVRVIRGTAGTVCGFKIMVPVQRIERFDRVTRVQKQMIINR